MPNGGSTVIVEETYQTPDLISHIQLQIGLINRRGMSTILHQNLQHGAGTDRQMPEPNPDCGKDCVADGRGNDSRRRLAEAEATANRAEPAAASDRPPGAPQG